MTEDPEPGHYGHGMVDGLLRHPDGTLLHRSGAAGIAAVEIDAPAEPEAKPAPDFLAVYDTYVDFVWRTARRLGVDAGSVDDVVQETFLVVHRRLASEQIWSLRGWIYGIAVAVVRNHRRTLRRKSPHLGRGGECSTSPDELPDRAKGPFDVAREAEANRVLHELLSKLDDEKRELVAIADVPVEGHRCRVELVGKRPHRERLHAARADDVDRGIHDALARQTGRAPDCLPRGERFHGGARAQVRVRAHEEAPAISSRSFTLTWSASLPGATFQPSVTSVSPGHTGFENFVSNAESFEASPPHAPFAA